jgi:enterochelin esterase-like enzyme
MKLKIITIVWLLWLFVPAILFAQGGRVFDNLSMTSRILKVEKKYSVYLPEDYYTAERTYPVLYLLHGSGDDNLGWVHFGEVKRIADKAISEGNCTSMIIVMPDANTGQRGYFNSPRGDWNYEDFFFSEFIPFIEKTYRIRAEKRYRAIAGLSMGGAGTLVYTLHHPELFSSACPLSAGRSLHDWDTFRNNFAKEYPGLSEEQMRNFYKRHTSFELLNDLPAEPVKLVGWYIDCGDDDSRFELNAKLHQAMRKKGISSELRIRDGGHTWTYWREALPSVLQFVSRAFYQS